MISVSNTRDLYAVLKQLDISVLSFQKEIIQDDDGTVRVVDKPKSVTQIIDELFECFYGNTSIEAITHPLNEQTDDVDPYVEYVKARAAIGALKFMYDGGAEFTPEQQSRLGSILSSPAYWRFVRDLSNSSTYPTRIMQNDDEPEREFDAFIDSFPTIGGDPQ